MFVEGDYLDVFDCGFFECSLIGEKIKSKLIQVKKRSEKRKGQMLLCPYP